MDLLRTRRRTQGWSGPFALGFSKRPGERPSNNPVCRYPLWRYPPVHLSQTFCWVTFPGRAAFLPALRDGPPSEGDHTDPRVRTRTPATKRRTPGNTGHPPSRPPLYLPPRSPFFTRINFYHFRVEHLFLHQNRSKHVVASQPTHTLLRRWERETPLTSVTYATCSQLHLRLGTRLGTSISRIFLTNSPFVPMFP